MATKQAGNSGSFKPGASGNPAGRPRKQAARRDGWINTASGHGTIRDRRTLTRYGVDIVTDIEALQLWRSEWLAAAIIEKRVKEAMRRGWHLKLEDKSIAEKICAAAETLGVVRAFVRAWMFERAYGGAAIFPVLSGALGDVSQELDPGGIASVDALHVFEPQELTPVDYEPDIRSPQFNQPRSYRLTPLNTGRTGYLAPAIIHASRLVVFPGIRVSRQTQPGQRDGWGDSVLSRPSQVLKDFGIAWGSAATLLSKHGMGTLQMDGLAEILAEDGGFDKFDQHIAAMQLAESTLRMRVVGERDTYTQSTGTLAGISDTLSQFERLVSGASDTPMSVLFGVGSAGLRTGDDETRGWYASVEGDRADHHLQFEQLIRLLLLSTAGPTGGREPETWSAEFPSLWSPSEKETAETRLADMQRAKIAIETGVASADDVAESFYKGDTYSGDIHIDWGRREAQAKIDQEQAANLGAADLQAMGAQPELAPGEPRQDEIDEADLEDLEAQDQEDDDTVWDVPDDDEDPAAALEAAKERVAELEAMIAERAA